MVAKMGLSGERYVSFCPIQNHLTRSVRRSLKTKQKTHQFLQWCYGKDSVLFSALGLC